MTILRRIRHALLGFAAMFLFVIAVGPTGQPRTAWQIVNREAPNFASQLITLGAAIDPIVRRTHPPIELTAQLMWQMSLTKHYADRDLNRELRQKERESSEPQTRLDAEPQQVRLVAHADEASDFEAPPIVEVAIPAEVLEAQTPRKPSDFAGHTFWNQQHVAAGEAYEKLQGMIEETVVAQPIAVLPGHPTRQALTIALVLGGMAALMMIMLDWTEGLANLLSRDAEDRGSDLLQVPATWFSVKPTLSARIASWTRVFCVVVVCGILTLTLFKTIGAPLAAQRLLHAPLAEVAAAI